MLALESNWYACQSLLFLIGCYVNAHLDIMVCTHVHVHVQYVSVYTFSIVSVWQCGLNGVNIRYFRHLCTQVCN